MHGNYLAAASLLGYGDPVFTLPIGSIGRASYSVKSPNALLRLCSCCQRDKNVLTIDVDAPAGWLTWGPTGLSGTLRVSLYVHECAALAPLPGACAPICPAPSVD